MQGTGHLRGASHTTAKPNFIGPTTTFAVRINNFMHRHPANCDSWCYPHAWMVANSSFHLEHPICICPILACDWLHIRMDVATHVLFSACIGDPFADHAARIGLWSEMDGDDWSWLCNSLLCSRFLAQCFLDACIHTIVEIPCLTPALRILQHEIILASPICRQCRV